MGVGSWGVVNPEEFEQEKGLQYPPVVMAGSAVADVALAGVADVGATRDLATEWPAYLHRRSDQVHIFHQRVKS